ncbi:MAG: hypothetical protein OSJ56_10015 [Prevotella sp.]|nr:hypothetical protein [Prevotella sp.]
MADLIALDFIQIGYKRYKPGDILPQDSPDVSAWIECGSAMWQEEKPPKRTVAKQAAAQSGMPGIAVGGEISGNDLVGRIPSTERRQR